MRSSKSPSPSRSWPLVLGFLYLLGILNHASAQSVKYCSEFNTATTGKNSSIYQSNGLCQNFCIANYAFAVVQYDGCWCSNYIPGSTTNGCNTECPGFPTDYCGGNGKFGYISLNMAPSGTQGADDTSSYAPSTISQKDTTTVTKTPDPLTVTFFPLSSSSTSQASESSPDSSTTKSSSTSTNTETTTRTSVPPTSESTSSTWTPTPITSLETVTGQVRTVTVTPTVPPSNQQNINGVTSKSDDDNNLSTGGAVGLTIGLVALVAIISSIVFFCIKKKRQNKADENSNEGSRSDSVTGLGGTVPSRTMSEHSRYVLGTDGRQVIETWEPEAATTPGSRRSRLMPVDPRLDPFAPVYQRGVENKSRESINTIRDDHDYSRRVHQQAPILRATNPDD